MSNELATTNAPVTQPAAGSRRHFHHTLVTTASARSIWNTWMDVPNWPRWDTELDAAAALEPLDLGVRGTLESGGRSMSFTVTQFDTGRSYTYETALPLGRLVVHRRIALVDGMTSFTHDVRFMGLGGWLLAPLLGKRFRAVLPRVMETLNQQIQP